MSNCSNINNTTIKGTSAVTYDSTPLPCTDVNTCDGLNTILSKFDAIICDVKANVDALTEDVMNLTEDVMVITEDITNINNQLDICCPTTTTTTTLPPTTTTTTTVEPTTTTTTSSSSTSTTTSTSTSTSTTTSTSTSTSTSTTTSTTSSTSTTTSTTTAAPAVGCIQFSNDFVTTSQDCLGTPYPLISATFTVELVDALGNPVIATEDITVNAEFNVRQCLDPGPVPITVPVLISTGTSSGVYSYTYERQYDCGQGECELEYEYFQSVVSISPSSYSLCSDITTTTTTTTIEPTTTTTTTGVTSYLYLGTANTYATSGEACLQGTGAPYYLPIPVIYVGQIVYTDPGLTTTFNGGSQWINVIQSGGSTSTAIQVDNSGNILAYTSC